MARAMAARFFIPPERAEGILLGGMGSRSTMANLDLAMMDYGLLGQVGKFFQRQHDVLQQGHGPEQGAHLIHDSELV